ncbi:two-component sensor histidine kinase, partial [Streptomyces nigra]
SARDASRAAAGTPAASVNSTVPSRTSETAAAGLRERVDVLGGEFSAGAVAGGGFVVRARIPAGGRS